MHFLLGCRRRPAEGTANPRGGDNPYVSPEGYNIIDVKFTGRFLHSLPRPCRLCCRYINMLLIYFQSAVQPVQMALSCLEKMRLMRTS